MSAKSPKKKDKPADKGKNTAEVKPAGVGGVGGGKPKKGNKKKKKGSKKKTDWADPDHFDPNRAMIYIEHTEECPIFKTKAMEFHTFLTHCIQDKTFLLLRNDNLIPRDGAFEISFSQNARTPKELIWSGIDKGPPRRDKFPETYNQLLPEVIAILNKLYMTVTTAEDDDNTLPMLDNVPDDDEEIKETAEKPEREKNSELNKVFKEADSTGNKSKRVSAGADQKHVKAKIKVSADKNKTAKSRKPIRKSLKTSESRETSLGSSKSKGGPSNAAKTVGTNMMSKKPGEKTNKTVTFPNVRTASKA